MKKKQSAILKWILLAVCLLAAGCFYSCGSRETPQTAVAEQKNRAFQAENVPESSGMETEQEASGKDSAADYAKTQDETDPAPETERASESSAAEPAFCYVYICGEVASPGVYTLPEGARIYEAVDLAGGFTDNAADSWLNLAEPVADGMKLEVPSKAQAKDPSWQAQNQTGTERNRTGGNAGAAGAGQPAALVNINTASREELMALKGIGASRAEDIIRYREEAGGFTKIEDIMKVPGIKDAAFQKIKENITV